ncbi:uncharacterized protein LOC112679900 [Sipha flava]|uniref:Uncharacterized protein LOC112679900 n=1 Tax=Sipha flava TaxID=143950 RepID=A0A8B8F5M0_9HEMI|nr:uncharacterized protein LOC112679900 [Sipha flava]
MIVLNIITLALAISAVATSKVQYESVPNENEWIFVAQNSVKDSVTKVKSYGEENEKLKVIANGAFNSFAEFAKKSLSEIIEQTNKTESEEVLRLKRQFLKWAEVLEKFNQMSEKTSTNKILGKFIFTIDFIVNEIVGFDKYNRFKSFEANQITEKLKLLLRVSAAKLVKYAKSMEDQVTEMFKTD